MKHPSTIPVIFDLAVKYDGLFVRLTGRGFERQQMLYMVGRRTGIFSCLAELDDRVLCGHAEKALVAHQVTLENVETWAAEKMHRFI